MDKVAAVLALVFVWHWTGNMAVMYTRLSIDDSLPTRFLIKFLANVACIGAGILAVYAGLR